MTRRSHQFLRTRQDAPLRGIPRHVGGRRVTPIRPPLFRRRGLNATVANIHADLMTAHNDIAAQLQAFRNARPGAQKSAAWRRVLGLRMWMHELRELRDDMLDDEVHQWQDEEDRQNAAAGVNIRVQPPWLSDSN